MSEITWEDVMIYCYSRNLCVVSKEYLEIIHRPIVVEKVADKNAIPVDFIWDRAEFYEKQWLEDDNHWAKNVAEALRALLEDWDGEVGGILDKYE